MNRLRQAWSFVSGLPALVLYGAVALSFLGLVIAKAYSDGRADVRAEVKIAVIKDEVLVAKAQTKLTDLSLKRLDEKIGRDAGIDERTDDARRQMDAVEVAPSGDAFADRLAALRAYRDISVRLRNDILAGRADYIEDHGERTTPGPVRTSGASYG